MFDILKGKFPIGGWVGPPAAMNGYPSLINDECFELLKDSGINIIYGNTEHNGSPDVMKGLELCEKFGVFYLINDSRYRNENFSVEEGLSELKRFQKYRSFIGIAAHDEPHLKDMQSLKLAKTKHKEVFEQTIFHTNLFPIYCDSAGVTMRETHERSSYEEYVNYIETYIDCVKPDHLSFDFYPFKGKFGECDPTYFENLEFIRVYAEKLNVPYWCFIQVTSWHKGIIRNTEEAEIRWQIFTSLAFGVKGINYFTFCTPIDNGAERFDDAMIDRDGNKTKSYDYVQNINKRVTVLGEELLYAEHKAIIPSKKNIAPLESKLIQKGFGLLKEIESETVMCGCFRNKDDDLYFLVNTDLSNSAEYVLKFNSPITLTNVENKKKYCGDIIKLELAPSDGMLFKINK